MNLLAYILLNGLLAFFVYEDFKHRAISAWALAAVLIVSVLYSANSIALAEIRYNSLYIILFLSVQVGLLELYYFLKRKRLKSVINEMIGIGDILFLFAIAPLFSPIQYIFSYIAGLIFVLIAYALIRQWLSLTIPLAGLYSIYLMLLLLAGRIMQHPWCTDIETYTVLNRYL